MNLEKTCAIIVKVLSMEVDMCDPAFTVYPKLSDDELKQEQKYIDDLKGIIRILNHNTLSLNHEQKVLCVDLLKHELDVQKDFIESEKDIHNIKAMKHYRKQLKKAIKALPEV